MVNRLWLRKAQWCVANLLIGFGMFTITLSVPDVATEHFGGVGVCPAHLEPSKACEEARSKAQLVIATNQALKAFLGFFMGPSLGAISDVYGRRFFLLTAISLLCLSHWLLCIVAYGYTNFWFYIISDTCSGFVPFLPALLSVVSDESPPPKRAVNFGLLMAMFEVPLLIIPVLAGALSLQFNALLACVATSTSLILFVLYGESLQLENRLAVLNTNERFWAPHQALAILNSAPIFRRLAVVILSNTLVLSGLQTCFILYVESAFHVSRRHASMYLSILAIGGLVAQLFALRILSRMLGLSRTMLIGLCLQFVQCCLLLIRTTPLLALSCSIGGAASMVFPCVSALKANATSEDQQGRIQGAVSGLQSFSLGLGPVLFGALFSYVQKPSTHIPQQFVFSVSVALLIPAIFAAACLHRVARLHIQSAREELSFQELEK